MQRIFVTGATGFLGSHIIDQLLKDGYRVRVAARGQKAQTFKSIYANEPLIEIVEVSDIAHDQFLAALEGIDAVIHAAAPLPGRVGINEMLEDAVEGALNVLRQAEKAGVRRFIVTSSTATVMNNGKGTFTDKDWNVITKEYALASNNKFSVYAAAKKYAELAVWDWAEAHPHVEVTTINPTMIYGPIGDNYRIPQPDFDALGTNLNIYQFINPTGSFPGHPGYVDFRDAARAHIGALQSPPTSEVGRKRVVLASPHGFLFKNAVDLIAKTRSHLKDRLIAASPPDFPYDRFDIDFERIQKITGMRKEDFHTLEETILDTIDTLLKVEAEWRSKGYRIDIPNSL